MSNCTDCGAELTIWDIGLHKKTVNRGAEAYRCIKCNGKHFNVGEDVLWEKIKLFQKQGCSLFPKPNEKKIKYQAHRGVSSEFPENTMASFRAAVKQGYDIIELDPAVTKDGKTVIMHDRTVNRTCRNAGGSEIERETAVSDLTYNELLTLDAGNGEKIPLLADVLAFAEENGITVKIDNKIQNFTEDALNEIFRIAAEHEKTAAFTCKTTDFAQRVHNLLPEAQIHYDGEITEDNLSFLRDMTGGSFTVWLPFDNKLTSWCKLKKADGDSVSYVKQYAKECGLWILTEPYELLDAKRYGADIIETPGQLKPEITHI